MIHNIKIGDGDPAVILMAEMKPGQLGILEPGQSYGGELVLCVSGLTGCKVCTLLSRDGVAWKPGCALLVRPLKPGTAVSFTV